MLDTEHIQQADSKDRKILNESHYSKKKGAIGTHPGSCKPRCSSERCGKSYIQQKQHFCSNRSTDFYRNLKSNRCNKENTKKSLYLLFQQRIVYYKLQSWKWQIALLPNPYLQNVFQIPQSYSSVQASHPSASYLNLLLHQINSSLSLFIRVRNNGNPVIAQFFLFRLLLEVSSKCCHDYVEERFLFKGHQTLCKPPAITGIIPSLSGKTGSS